MKKENLQLMKRSVAKERREKISNGTWMPRGAVMLTGKQKAFKRSALKKQLNKELVAIG